MKKYRGLTRKSGKRAVWTGRVRLDREALDIPAGWKKPRRIFVNSMSDLFHEAVPAEVVAAVLVPCRYEVVHLSNSHKNGPYRYGGIPRIATNAAERVARDERRERRRSRRSTPPGSG